MKLLGENPYAPAVRPLWRPPRELTVDRWAEERLFLPPGVSATPGPLSLELNPYLRGPLRLLTDPDVEEITLCFSTQVGKTLFLICALLHAIVEKRQGALLVMPRKEDAQEIAVERFTPILRASRRLADLLSGRKHELTGDAIRIAGVPLNFAWATSPMELASRSVGTLAFDETDKFPPWSGRDADPIELGIERTRTFPDMKVLKASTPTTERGYIWQELHAAAAQCRYHVPCPHCGEYQALVFGERHEGTGGIKWPKGADPRSLRPLSLAWYECEHCHARIDDAAKSEMLSMGEWSGLEAKGSVGLHLSALYSPWLTWSDIAAKFLASKDKPAKLMNFRNGWLAEVFEDRFEEIRGEHLRTHVLPYSQCEVPDEAYVITAGVDVQADHFWYVLRAWGAHGRSWLVRCGRVESWEALRTVLFRSTYRFKRSGEPAKVVLVVVDSGHRTDEVYRFCRHAGCQALKGYREQPRPWRRSKVELAGQKLPLLTIDTSYYKAALHRLMRTTEADPEAWFLPQNMPEDYWSHMTAEQRVREVDKRTGRVKLVWRVLYEGVRNDLFDCEVYALVAADILDIPNRFTETPRRGEERSKEPSEEERPQQAAARRPPRKRPHARMTRRAKIW